MTNIPRAAFNIGDRVGITIGPEGAEIVRTGIVVEIELPEGYWVNEGDDDGPWIYDADELRLLETK